MQKVSSAFTAQSGANTQSHYPAFGVQISFTKSENPAYQFFTIGTSLIGGADFIPGAGTFPAFFDQYQFTDYTDYAISLSITRNLGQYPYGAFGADAQVELDNTSLMFTSGVDPTIGSFITLGRPIKLQMGFGSETINLFSGFSTQPVNDFQNRQLTMGAFDGMDALNNFTSHGAGPTASSNNGNYVNIRADLMIQDLLLEVGLSSSEFVLEQSLQEPIGYYCPNGLLVGDIIRAVCEAEQAIAFFDENGIFHFWNRQHIYNNQASVWTFDEKQSIFEYKTEETTVLNDVIIQGKPRTVAADQLLYTDGQVETIPAPTLTTVLTNLCTNPNFNSNVNNWATSGGTLTQNTTNYYEGNGSAQFVSGGAGQYMYHTVTVSTSTQYGVQMRLNGTAGQQVVVSAVENSVTLSSYTQTLTGNWDAVTVPTFTTDGTHTSLQVRVTPASGNTVYVDTVLIIANPTSVVTYFDGNSAATTSYIYAWTGSSNASTSTATPCGSLTVTASFSDADGDLPVVSVDALQYYTTPGATSLYRVNSASDNTGSDMLSYVKIQNATLTTNPQSATTISGSTYTITFLNTNSSPVYVTRLQLWGKPAKLAYDINKEYQSIASMNVYGTNPANNGQPLVIQNDLVQDPNTAYSNAYTLVTDFSTPYQRAQVNVTPVPQLQIGDTVTIAVDEIMAQQHTPMGMLMSLTQTQNNPQYTEFTIVGITLNSSPSNLLEQILELEVRVLVSYFTIGTSAIGGNDQIAP